MVELISVSRSSNGIVVLGLSVLSHEEEEDATCLPLDTQALCLKSVLFLHDAIIKFFSQGLLDDACRGLRIQE